MSPLEYNTIMIILSIGTNLGNKTLNINNAIAEINKICQITAISSPLTTEPWGFKSSNSFLNIAISIETNLTPLQLLDATQKIETLLGRTAKSSNLNYADRIIDIDIIAFNSQIINSELLTIPHPLAHKRDFVLIPIAEIAPQWIHPTLQLSASQLLANLRNS